MIRSERIHDERENKGEPWGFVVFTDSFLSGWGGAPRRSLYCLAVNNPREADTVLDNGQHRSDMKRGRIVGRDYLRTVKLYPGDHLKVTDKTHAERWYRPNSFGGRD